MSGAPTPGASALAAWIVRREPQAPEALLGRTADQVRVPEPLDGAVDALVEAARSGLADARRRIGERRGAFRLLEADACLTYACEAALDATDPTRLLGRILDGVVAEAEAE